MNIFGLHITTVQKHESELAAHRIRVTELQNCCQSNSDRVLQLNKQVKKLKEELADQKHLCKIYKQRLEMLENK